MITNVFSKRDNKFNSRGDKFLQLILSNLSDISSDINNITDTGTIA